jgi:hypothetical protein
MANLNTLHRGSLLAALACAAFLLNGCSRESDTHASFATPEEAVAALLSAIEQDDTAALARLFGPGAEGLTDSGDPVADKAARASFLERYRAAGTLVAEGETRRLLQLGEEAELMPVPIEQRDGRWYFDGAEGVEEMVYRRVGRNELGAIGVMRGFVEAQIEYAATPHDGNPAGVYAMRLMSDPGRQNGLYYATEPGEPESPVGPFIAAAAAEGYIAGSSNAYHGYRYRPLFGQSANANGGELSYFEDGLLVNGFALLAWPAEYGVSGVMTFIVNQDGVVFQKDLGADTDALVESIELFDPGDGWVAVTEPEA